MLKTTQNAKLLALIPQSSMLQREEHMTRWMVDTEDPGAPKEVAWLTR